MARLGTGVMDVSNMSDEAIAQALDALGRENEKVAMENELFDNYLNRNQVLPEVVSPEFSKRESKKKRRGRGGGRWWNQRDRGRPHRHSRGAWRADFVAALSDQTA